MKGLPFVLGTDIICISRLDPIQRSAVFVKLAKRILRPDEIPGTKSKPNYLRKSGTYRELSDWLSIVQQAPQLSPSTDANEIKFFEREAHNASRWLAGRWAAKEAAMKAWGAGLISFRDVKVGVDLDAPYVEGSSRPVKIECRPLYEEVAKYLGRDWEGNSEEGELFRQNGRLSISHDGDYCVATVMAEPLNEHLMNVFRARTNTVRERQANDWRSVDTNNAEFTNGSDGREKLLARHRQAHEQKPVEDETVKVDDNSATTKRPSVREKLPDGWKPMGEEIDEGNGAGSKQPWYEGRS